MAQPKRMKVNGLEDGGDGIKSDERAEEEAVTKDVSWTRMQDRVLLEPFEYVCKIPGKKIRSKLIQVSRFAGRKLMPRVERESVRRREQLGFRISQSLVIRPSTPGFKSPTRSWRRSAKWWRCCTTPPS